jgi:hypothetical protein
MWNALREAAHAAHDNKVSYYIYRKLIPRVGYTYRVVRYGEEPPEGFEKVHRVYPKKGEK